MAKNENYIGKDRRRNKIFVTRNTEYHLSDGVCVGVRDRRTESWNDEHLALGHSLAGGVRILANGEAIPTPEAPIVGDSLYFTTGSRELITSVLCGVERPAREVALLYAS